jgi:hypothetical protein
LGGDGSGGRRGHVGDCGARRGWTQVDRLAE